MQARNPRPLAAGAAFGAALLLAACSLFGPHEKRALARLAPAPGYTARGVVSFIERADGMQVTYNLAGLAPGHNHGFHVHEGSNCQSIQRAPGDDVFNPDNVPLGQSRDGARAVGELPDLHADANGVATGFVVMPGMTLDGIHSVLGRGLVVHRDPDDPYSATDDTGPVVACGVIVK